MGLLGLSPIGLNFGLGAIPASPVIASVTDNGDQDSIDVVVVGIETVTLFYRVKFGTAWTTGQTRAGSGTITQTGLVAGTWYELYITDTVQGIESPPSKISVIRVVDSDDNTIETALYATVIEDATVNAIIGTRFFPNVVPQSAKIPAATYMQISGPRVHSVEGALGMVKARYQINCWAAKYSTVKDLAEAIRKQLDGFSGTVNTVQIQSIMLVDEGDFPKLTDDAEVTLRYGKRLDFIIWFQEATG